MALLFLLLSAAWVDAAIERINLSVDSVDYLITEYTSEEVIARKWSAPDTASPGSLLKPFVALAYGRDHQLTFPVIECTGATCWLPAGHGQVNITRALAHSCNTYFRQLSQQVSVEAVGAESSRLGLRAPPPNTPPNGLWGLLSTWISTPEEILRSYTELVRRRGEPATTIVLNGLRQAAKDGTASAIGQRLPQGAFAKTGTSNCTHPRAADGDGFAVAIYPVDSPRYAVAVRVHNRTGRTAAAAAAAIVEAVPTR